MKSILARIAGVVLVALCVPAAAGEKPAAAPQKTKTTLKLKADLIVFEHAKGKMQLKGNVHVVRTVDDESMFVDCDEMDAEMKDGKMTDVLARGRVRLRTKEFTGKAVRAKFDFKKNVIRLYGEKGKAATVETGQVTSTGPVIIFYLDSQRVELPKGGDTIVHARESSEEE